MFWKRKKKVDPTKPPKFLMGEGPSTHCYFCALEGGREPLPHPPILIPSKPVWIASKSKWTWGYKSVCLKHAKQIIRKLKVKHLDPLEK